MPVCSARNLHVKPLPIVSGESTPSNPNTLPVATAPPPETRPTLPGTTTEGGGGGESGDAAAGQAVFASAGCGGCHTLKAAGASGSVGPNLDQLHPDFEAVHDQVEHGGGGMPAFNADYEDAIASFPRAIATHKFTENEYIIDTFFWIARSHLKRNERAEARTYLEKSAASDVRYEKKPQAVELLAKVS